MTSWLVQATQEQIISLLIFVQLSVFHYVFIIFTGRRKSQGRILTLGWVRSKHFWELLLQHLPEGCHQTKTPALNFKVKRLLLNTEWQFFTLNAGKLLLLVACHFMFPTAVVLETRNVMHYNVQVLNRKRKYSLFQYIIIVSEPQEYCCEHTFWYS